MGGICGNEVSDAPTGGRVTLSEKEINIKMGELKQKETGLKLRKSDFLDQT